MLALTPRPALFFCLICLLFSGAVQPQMSIPPPLKSKNFLVLMPGHDGRIPLNALVKFGPRSTWEEHGDAFIVAAIALLIQSLLIILLLIERRQRQRSGKRLAEQLRFEAFGAGITASLANSNVQEFDDAVRDCLLKAGVFFDHSIASIWQRTRESRVWLCTHSGSDSQGRFSIGLGAPDFSKTAARLANGEDIYFSNEMDTNQLEDYKSFRQAGTKSYLAVPFRVERQIVGCLSLSNQEKEITWSADDITRIHIISEILGNTFERKNARDALQVSESLSGSILNSMQSGVAVLDSEGFILSVNKRWKDLMADRPALPIGAEQVGGNYFDKLVETRAPEAAAATAKGIRSVLSGSLPFFEEDYSYDSKSERRWLRMVVTRLSRNRGGAVVSYSDISTQKMAELERARIWEEILQTNRTRELGHLAASLAHELAQPLSGILSNAQAASRMTIGFEPKLSEIQNTLADIIEDDKRAGAVLDSVRSIMRKSTIRPHSVNLNEIVKNVSLIVRNEIVSNGVRFQSIPFPDAVLVQGDEAPLQQVLLNLLNNAISAMRPLQQEQRILTVKTQVRDGSGWLVVEDEGPGVPEPLKDKLFLPFFTTKSDGLGMGLSICATIVESLGGSISFANRPDRGAAFSVRLRQAPPLDSLD
jgi:signal transduction histidine kinase